MNNRSAPVVTAGFGILLVVIGLFGWGTNRRAEQIYIETSSLHRSFQHTEDVLNEMRAELHLSGILVRDFLLDTSTSAAATHIEALTGLRSTMDMQLNELERQGVSEQAAILKMLHMEIDAYWDALAPMFEWTPSEKLARSLGFLQGEVLPRREAVLAIAREIRDFNEDNFKREQQETDVRQEGFRWYIRMMSAAALLLGVLVAGVSIFRISRLEGRAREQREATERAAQELRRLSHQLARAQEEERRSISRELHDEIGQMLTALRMEVGNLEEVRTDEHNFKRQLDDTKRLINRAVQIVRDLAMGLRPAMLDELGLSPAVKWQAREFSRRSGIDVSVQVTGYLDGLPDAYRIAVYRVVQEALTNCARHSEATNVRITLQEEENTLSLTIQDDGVGFDPRSPKKELGLVGIEERVLELGGKLTIYSQPHKGTLLQANIPLFREVDR
jgi:signal transduction histidine kinase